MDKLNRQKYLTKLLDLFTSGFLNGLKLSSIALLIRTKGILISWNLQLRVLQGVTFQPLLEIYVRFSMSNPLEP